MSHRLVLTRGAVTSQAITGYTFLAAMVPQVLRRRQLRSGAVS